MMRLVDWTSAEPKNAGTPGWWVLHVEIQGTTPTSHRSVFASVEVGCEEKCRVLVSAEYGDAEAEVITPYKIDLWTSREGVSRYRLIGESLEEEFSVYPGPA
jgi:hypothetical protein